MSDNPDFILQKILADAIFKRYSDADALRIKTIVRELVFAPHDRMIKINELKKLSAEDLRFMVARELECPIEQISVFKQENDEKEYFEWLKNATDVLKHLNDGYVTEDDAKERKVFLSLIELRECALMACLGLYQESNAPSAQSRMNIVRYKVQKLREIRSAILFLTREESSVITTKSEFDAAKPYYQYFKNLQGLPFGYDAPIEKRRELGISHETDGDLRQDYDYYKGLLNKILDEMAALDEELEESPEVRQRQKRNKSSDKMKEIAGR